MVLGFHLPNIYRAALTETKIVIKTAQIRLGGLQESRRSFQEIQKRVDPGCHVTQTASLVVSVSLLVYLPLSDLELEFSSL